MERGGLVRREEMVWELKKSGDMRVPAFLYASRPLIDAMEDTVFAQLKNVASLPGIVNAAYAMPDAHSGYGFPVGGVAAFDPDEGGVVSAGGVGFDISCGVRALITNLSRADLEAGKNHLADRLFAHIPAGLGGGGTLRLSQADIDRMLAGGASWAVKEGYGETADLERIEEGGKMAGAMPDMVSDLAKSRQRDEVGTLGSGNHYLEIQYVEEVFDDAAAEAYGLKKDQVTLFIHCGSRGLGHQIGTDYLKRMLKEAPKHGLILPDKELGCAPIASALGAEYIGAMRAGINCALANRQVITHLCREVFAEVFPGSRLTLLYDVSHNTCKLERHTAGKSAKHLYVHRKGATRAFGPHHPELPGWLAGKGVGQPVLVGGSMGTASYILSGADASLSRSFASAPHGAGRLMSRKQATKRFQGRAVIEDLARMGILVRAHGFKGVAEEAPGAYKDIEAVVDCAHRLGLSLKTARVRPLACIKG